MGQPTLIELAARLAETQTALNIVWTTVAACLVMFMQAGFALVETGFARSKNAAHTMAINFLVYSIGILAYWLVGFGLQMGGVGEVASLGGGADLSREFTVTILGKQHGLFGGAGFCLPPKLLTPAIACLFFFQMVFMNTGTIIPTGALIERWKFIAFILFSFAVAGFIYPVYANWVWGGGFLAKLGANFGLGHGHVDFAGSSVVHMTGGMLAFVGAALLGPRLGKYGPRGEVNAIPGHNIPMVVLGTFVLAFGWFGFNAGSTLAGMETRLAVVAVNTLLSSAAGALSGALYSWRRFGKPDVTMMCNGMLGGLVAITAPCAFVASASALLIGAVAGVLVIEATLFVERKLLIDDPVGAISVHGVCGSWGILALGLLADGTFGAGLNGVAGNVTGLFYGDVGQLVASTMGIGFNILWVTSAGALVFLGIERLVGNRVAAEDELRGLDLTEMGMDAYYGPAPAGSSQPSPPSPSQPRPSRPRGDSSGTHATEPGLWGVPPLRR